MSLNLSDSISNLHGIGNIYEKKLNSLGIFSIKDLLWYFPFRYQDFANIKQIGDLIENEPTTIVGKISNLKSYRSFRRHMLLTEGKIIDESGKADVIWFNQPYLAQQLKEGTVLTISGKPKPKGAHFVFSSPSFEIISKEDEEELDITNLKHTGRLIPIYSETSGISSKLLRAYIKNMLKFFSYSLTEYLPSKTMERNNLFDIKDAINKIHFPNSKEEAEEARNRFIFEEMLLTQFHLLHLKSKAAKLKSPVIKTDIDLIKKFLTTLPFILTEAQRKAIWEIAKDLEKGSPMNRLLEGDVGSGKTMVALISSLLTVSQGYQVAFMAPTEVLAQQHFQTIVKYLNDFDIKIGIITSDGARIKDGKLEGKVTKEYIIKEINEGEPWLIIGTHALIQKSIDFGKLGLIIIDEQHRFGINQRKELLKKNSGLLPHFLSMTATPIPRTLALAVYGDLDLSILDEMPLNRKKILTKIVSKAKEKEMLEFIRKEIKNGRQAFVICPRVEESEKEVDENIDARKKNLFDYSQLLNYEVKAVKKEVEEIKKVFPEYNVEMLHGKMKSIDKEKIMKRFKENQTQILVATSVIEVGVDIPNASIMLIEGTEHFGLAQLHQFRGRVGRGEHQSYCFLFTESRSKNTRERLKAMIDFNDGFKLAEIDLKLRGPGEMFGRNQSGFPDLAMSALKNVKMLANIQIEAKQLFKDDPMLKKEPLFLKRYTEFVNELHME